jgi:hypothetical protein
MKTFKQHLKESSDKPKGAFKNYPKEQQPSRIPIQLYDDLEASVRAAVGSIGNLFVPSIKKVTYKDTAGDLDVIIDPNDRQAWKQEILNILGDKVVARENNGPQMMLVVKDLLPNGDQYMIDFILAKEGSFDYRKKYSQFGTIIPAVLGSFARSLRYKYEQNGLYARMQDKKGNYHNELLTKNYEDALKILMLDPKAVENDDLYTPEKVVKWITDSPRFDTNTWRRPPSADGQTIVTKNIKSHRAAKGRDDVKEAYELIDKVNKKGTWNNEDYKIERIVLGDDFVNGLKDRINSTIQKSNPIITGDEVIRITGLTPGPEIGNILKYINTQKLSREEAIKYLKDYNENV